MEKDFNLDEYARERDAYISDMEKYTEHLNKFREQKQEQLDKLSAEEETEYVENRANNNLEIARDVFKNIEVVSKNDNGGKK